MSGAVSMNWLEPDHEQQLLKRFERIGVAVQRGENILQLDALWLLNTCRQFAEQRITGRIERDELAGRVIELEQGQQLMPFIPRRFAPWTEQEISTLRAIRSNQPNPT